MCKSPTALQLFKDALRKSASEKSSDRITNKSKEYAVAFYAELFKATSRSVKIYCEGAHSCIWTDKDFLKAFRDMIERGQVRQIQILTEENKPNLFSEDLLDILRAHEDLIDMRHLNNDSRNIIESRFEGDINFALFDSDKFRFEFDKREFRAYGSFNDSDVVSNLVETFDQAFVISDRTALPAINLNQESEEGRTWTNISMAVQYVAPTENIVLDMDSSHSVG